MHLDIYTHKATDANPLGPHIRRGRARLLRGTDTANQVVPAVAKTGTVKLDRGEPGEWDHGHGLVVTFCWLVKPCPSTVCTTTHQVTVLSTRFVTVTVAWSPDTVIGRASGADEPRR
jgi:hypothetical protein